MRLRSCWHARLRAAGLVLATAVAVPADAQTTATGTCADTARLAAADFATSDRDLARVLQLAGALPAAPALHRRAGTERELPVCRDAARFLDWALEDAPGVSRRGVRLLPVVAEMESNSSYRKDRNNGGFRGGVGPSVALGAAVEFRWKGITAVLAPRFVRERNSDFPTVAVVRPGYSPFVYPYQQGGYLIDFPQRFGTEADTRVEPGQSYLRFGTRHFEAGASTENFWLGSAQVYPILVSATAPGFPHLFIGTVEPLDLWIAKVGVHAVVGRLSESDFFDTLDDNDVRFFSAAVVEVSPRWIPGLQLGVARVIEEVVPPDGLSMGHYVGSALNPGFTFRGGGNPIESNGIGALLARWVFPDAGFEAYAEWSREDTPYDLRDLLEEPDWTQAYTLGFHQLVTLEPVRLRWYGELVHLGEAAPVRAGKGLASYYTHTRVPQGHTHQGQILGASPGPGSDAQIFGVDGFHAWGWSGLWLERTRYDEDTYYRRWARIYGESRHDVELGIGLRHAMALGPLWVGGELLYNRRANRAFLGMEDRTLPRQVNTNLGLRLRVAWRP
ncbi:MAG: hypothetical protein Q8N53_20875 [Longimicrobiales bacterium]|nr:hypothetical protein [Longimicrobiales bacterium]